MKKGPPKIRLDQLLVEKGFCETRAKAQALIMAGCVLIEDIPETKAGMKISPDSVLRIRSDGRSSFVSRGGDKIDPMFDFFHLTVEGKVCLDVGSSTGGFTDALLKRGAAHVYAVDVGTNQLDFRLRENPKVSVMENTHAHELPSLSLLPKPTFCTVDVSFIGLRKVLSSILSACEKPCTILALVKPQFELEKAYISKGGVVKDKEHQQKAVQLVKEFGISIGLIYKGDTPCQLRGEKKGNQEYFICFEANE